MRRPLAGGGCGCGCGDEEGAMEAETADRGGEGQMEAGPHASGCACAYMCLGLLVWVGLVWISVDQWMAERLLLFWAE